MRSALAKVCGSEIFTASPRLQEFLRYVVEQALSGKSARIKGKTIAIDVYGRDLQSEPGSLNLVRVEARRLRRSLTEYYAGEGSNDPIRIEIHPGGYKPHFVEVARPVADQTDPVPVTAGGRLRNMPLVYLGIGLIVIAFGIWSIQAFVAPGNLMDQKDRATREALREHSVPTLQAVNLADQARGMIFPLFDAGRQKLALDMFRHVIQLDPSVPHGYAGSAQVLATLSMITPDKKAAARYLNDARALANQGLDIDPSNAWAHGAMGWVQATSGHFDDALRHARIALDLSPEDGYVLDLVGKTAIVAKNPELAALVADPRRSRSGAGRFGAQNIWGVAQYMLGDYPMTIKAFSEAPAKGAPVSPPSLIFLAVAHDHLGNTSHADKLVSELKQTWPDFPTSFLIRQIFHEGSRYEQDILQRLSSHDYFSN